MVASRKNPCSAFGNELNQRLVRIVVTFSSVSLDIFVNVFLG